MADSPPNQENPPERRPSAAGLLKAKCGWACGPVGLPHVGAHYGCKGQPSSGTSPVFVARFLWQWANGLRFWAGAQKKIHRDDVSA